MSPYCCYNFPGTENRCPNDATVEIITVRDGGRPGGPDPYCDDTHSCDDHVGLLLGHQPEAVNPEQIYWEVHSL
jgi:hypothetical protein